MNNCKSLLTRKEILEILETNTESGKEKIFAAARKIRKEQMGEKIFAYGFVYFTTWCRNDCNFCYYRKSNNIDRYRKTEEETLAVSKALANEGVNLIDLTMGEDLAYHKENFKSVLSIVETIKKDYGLPVMISPGVINDKTIEKFAESNTDWYALYQETHNENLFRKLRINQSYDERMHAKLHAKKKGMLIEEGLLVGVGESLEDIADSILTMGEIGAKQVRVMSFIPQEGSPMERVKSPDRDLELKVIAAMRLAYPKALIPASLDVDGIEGLKDRVNAGSSVVTSIIPPKSGLMGVAHSTLEVDEGGRTVSEADEILKTMGLRIATTEEYKDYLGELQ